MGPLLLLLLLALSWTAALNLLSFGDSVDRMMVEDWCAAYGASKLPTCGGYECTYWLEAAGILKPRIFPTSSMFCSAAKANDTVAFVQVYGSPDTMPYFKNGNADNTGNSYRNNYHVNTPERIKAGVDGYFKLVGVPDLVVFNSVLWDVSRLYETQGTWKQPLHGDYDFPHSPLFNASVVDFEINLRKRIQDIETALGRNLFNLTTATTTANNTLSTLQRRVRDRMGLRTAVYNVANGVLVRAFNDIIRRVAAELELTLYDYDMDLWSHVGYDVALEKKLLRDFLHPLPVFTVMAADKMLRKVYSNALKIVGAAPDGAPRVWWPGSGEPRPKRLTKVLLLRDAAPIAQYYQMSWNAANNNSRSRREEDERAHLLAKSTFYVVSEPDNSIRRRMSGVTPTVLRCLELGPADILHLPAARLVTIPVGPPLPHSMFEKGFRGVVNASGTLLLLSDGERRAIPLSALPYYNLSIDHSSDSGSGSTSLRQEHQNDERLAEQFFSLLFKPGPPVPDIYSDSTLVRWAGARDVYAVLNGSLHAVPSVSVFVSHGWDFSQVKVITQKSDMDLIPMGAPLSR